MSRIETAVRRYAASSALTREGVELVAVGDPAGARLNAAIIKIRLAARDDGPELWEGLLQPAVALRWRLITQPQAQSFNPGLAEAAAAVVDAAARMRSAVGDQAALLLDAISDAASEVAAADPVVGAVLLQSIQEAGAEQCLVLAARPRAAVGIADWLAQHGVAVTAVGGVRQTAVFAAQGYAAGHPAAFSPSIVTAPTVAALSFLFPAWVTDRSIPRSAIARYAEGAPSIRSRLHREGAAETVALPAEPVEDQLTPQPIWTIRVSTHRPRSDEVLARRVLLSGSLAIYLDTEGERIRALDPSLPPGERVVQSEVTAIREGSYLVLREGQSEAGALYLQALLLMGKRREQVMTLQSEWKERLLQRLDDMGSAALVRSLKAAGVRRADWAPRTWILSTVTRPQSDTDFERLLQWLGIEVHPTFELATELRRMRFKAGWDVREQLEDALAKADLSALERDGHLRLEISTPGFRGIIATRVLAISPIPEVVPRNEARVPFPDQGAQWHE